jgi:hypothetical protein
MNTSRHVDHSKGNPRFARRIGSVKAEPVAGLECVAGTPVGPFGSGRRCHPVTGQKTFDTEGEILKHALTKCLRARNDAIKSLCSAVRRVSRCDLKRKLQERLPTGSPGNVESSELVLPLTGSSVPTAHGLILCGPRTSHARRIRGES